MMLVAVLFSSLFYVKSRVTVETRNENNKIEIIWCLVLGACLPSIAVVYCDTLGFFWWPIFLAFRLFHKHNFDAPHQFDKYTHIC